MKDLSIVLLALVAALSAANKLENQLILGVYVPWERCRGQAEYAGKDLMTFAEDVMRLVAEDLHGNAVWFVNGPSLEEADKVMDLAADHGITVMGQTALNGLFVHGLRTEEQLDQAVARTVAALAAKPALGAYVLKDEAKAVERTQMEMYRQALAAADPQHPSIIVTMTGHTEPYVSDTGFPIICTDIYHFGGDRSPYIPSPAHRSQKTYRDAVAALVGMCGAARKVPWVMPQSFASVWGPWWLADDGTVVIEPGAYWHWRMPTPAELRWQTWEVIRQGGRGVVYFPLLGAPPHGWRPGEGELPERLARARADAAAKGLPVAREPVRTGQPMCLTGPGMTMTPNAEALGDAFAAVGAHEELLLSVRPSGVPAVFADAPGAIQTFQRQGDPARYAVVVNDDLEARRELQLRTFAHVSRIIDLGSGTSMDLGPAAIADAPMLAANISLEPGSGTILKLEFAGHPGRRLYDEQFGNIAVTATLENVERRVERRGYGMGSHAVVRKTGGIDDDAAIVLADVQPHHHGRGSYLAGALRAARDGHCRVWLLVDGYCPNPEDIVISFHDADGKPGWHKTDAYHLPIVVPPDTTAIRIRLTGRAAVARIRLWRTPIQEE